MDDLPPLISPKEAMVNSFKYLLMDQFRPHLANRDVIYIDYPVHLNVGDLLIMKGTEALFHALNVNIIEYICERNQERLFRNNVGKDIVLVLHGGGNFGDIYPHHQALRERVIEAYPDNKILVMPQSVHYQDGSKLAHVLSLLKSHKNLYMFVRDEYSLGQLNSAFDNEHLKLLPDMAFCISDWWRSIDHVPEKVLSLRRRDVEAINTGNQEDSFDWADLFNSYDWFCYKLARRLARYENKLLINLGLAPFWKWYSQRLILRAVKKFTAYRVVDTDRLHGMILALLIGNEVVMRDNSYGKLHRFATYWLGLNASEFSREIVNSPVYE